MKGIYVLLIGLDRPGTVTVGGKRRFDLREGFYGYVGSGLSGLEKRLERYLRTAKKRHWHIDYLLSMAGIRNIIYAETGERQECLMAQTLSRRLQPITGFGCSDCRCRSHLFFCQDLKALETSVRSAFENLGLSPSEFG